jgi:hypothetical protein
VVTPPPDTLRADAAWLERQLQPFLARPLRAAVLERLLAASSPGPGLTLDWPEGVAPMAVVAWLRVQAPEHDATARLVAAIERAVERAVERGEVAGPAASADATPGRPLDALWLSCVAAHAFCAWQAIQHDLRRPMIAVDAGRPHHDLVCGMRDLPKDQAPRTAKRIEGRLEILAPDGRAVQLLMPLHGLAELQRATIETLRQWRGWEGVRHWAGLQRLWSVEGGRTGVARWTLDAHLAALGYADRARRDPAVRRRVAREVELLTCLQLAVYAPDGSLRARQPLLAATTKYDAIRHDPVEGETWTLEGMELRINEWLYHGVRDPKTGALGSDWYPAPIELAQIDHVRFPYAIVLGLVLPMRWRWDLGTRDHCALSGANLLATAGIKLSKGKPGRAWETLRRNLDELQRRGGLGRYEWDGAPWTFAAVCRLYPPQWVRDRTVHGLRPYELPPPPPVLTGAELRAWRKTKGWTQAAAAERLGVSVRTIKRAEAAPKTALGPALCEALARLWALEVPPATGEW